MENTSWIKLFRKFKEWEWYQDYIVKDVFIEILLTANFEDKRWQGINIKRGQLVTSVNSLLIALNKNIKNPKISKQNIRTALNKLKSTNELTIRTTNKYTIITVNKYNEYQGDNKQTNIQLTNNQQTTNKQLTTTKEYKNIKKDKRSNPPPPLKTYTDKNYTFEQVAERLIEAFNVHLNRKFKLAKGLKPNIEYWLDNYEPCEIEKAIINTQYDDFWKDKMTPTILFRRKNQQGEPVDYIGQLLIKKQNDDTRKLE